MANGDQWTPTIQDPSLFQGIFEQVLGIPERGRDIYSGWLADKWQDAVNAWALATAPELADPLTEGGVTTQGWSGQPLDLSFEDWLNKVKGTAAMFGDPGKSANLLTRIQALDPTISRDLIDAGGTLGLKGASGALNWALQRDLQNRFGRLGGLGMYRQQVNQPAMRAYQLNEARRALTPEGMAPDQSETFLQRRIQALRDQFGF